MAIEHISRAGNENAISSTDRIKELNVIDQDIVRLVRAAGLAINSVTPLDSSSSEASQDHVTPEARKEAFKSSTADYFRLLDSISVRLRRQIFALEEAEILPAEIDSTFAGPATTGAGASLAPPGARPVAAAAPVGVPAGNMGNLDIGWLNSRSDVVGRTMEAELWAKARSFLETLNSHPEQDLTEEMQDVEMAPLGSTGEDE
ncbi:MAG: hypothetical protein M1823_001484 [Watsoniomyces obsoletus]|nr:MAG: hypothetical protein M1823_001484 [Watsoniomyces obsoletus]